MDNLIEQLRAHRDIFDSIGMEETRALLAKAADTLAAQSRLLALAETLASDVEGYYRPDQIVALETMKRSLAAFTAAQAEYQTAGKVPCSEYTKTETEAKTLGETIDELLKGSEAQHKRLMVAVYGFEEDATFSDTLTVIEKLRSERDDLRRQLVESEKRRIAGEEAAKDYVAKFLAKIEADNAALVEAKSLFADELGRRKNLGAQVERLTDDNAALIKAIDELTAACEYKDIGKVPCPECANHQASSDFWNQAHAKVSIDSADLRRQLDEARNNEQNAVYHSKVLEGHVRDWSNRCDQLEADNAAFVEALRTVSIVCICGFDRNPNMSEHASSCYVIKVRHTLSQPHPGARMLEEVAALRKVVEAARSMCEMMHTSALTLMWMKDTVDALEELDALRNQEGR